MAFSGHKNNLHLGLSSDHTHIHLSKFNELYTLKSLLFIKYEDDTSNVPQIKTEIFRNRKIGKLCGKS